MDNSDQRKTDRMDRLERENEQLRERLADEAETVPDLVTSGGQPSKVVGVLPDTDGIGVYGEATGDGTTRGVEGVAQSSSDDAAGVCGRAADTSGVTFGVKAITSSTNGDAAGLRAFGRNGNADGIQGTAYGSGGVGVVGTAKSGANYGVSATNEASSGTAAYGLFAYTSSSDAPAIYSLSGNEVAIESESAIDASTGYRGAVGSSAYLSSDFSLTNSFRKVEFDSLVADQRDEFDTSNHWFECGYDGAYAVELGLESTSNTTGSLRLSLEIDRGTANSNPAVDQELSWDFVPGDSTFARTYTKTIYGLLAGNRISIWMKDTASSAELTSRSGETFLAVRQVGGGGNHTDSPVSSRTSPSSEETDEES
ncbi:hypothetical protein BRD17_09075 [Halobacteriales archaeon SW_7_68_16]|nr:MAG: hypothetical protein BRD17_09075 [Halobacteriales archaeon SW_7_68_16]